ncbi:MAG: hypothetical protein ACRDM1_12680 [Gaiellaceae bacterium]
MTATTSSSTRRCCAWLVALPMMLLGTQLAHALAYRLAYPTLSVRVHVLAVSGHGYLAMLPLALGVAGATAACTLVWAVLDATRGRAPRPIPPAAFALLPLLAFTLQEFTERWLAVGGLPWWMIEQPTFRIGLLLQLPFGAAAFALTRLLLRGARRLGRRLTRPGRPQADPAESVVAPPAGLPLSGRRLPAARSTRGPPLFAGC